MKPVHLGTMVALWLGGFMMYGLALLAYLGLRPDLADAFTRPLYVIEIAILAGLIISAAFTAASLSFPDRHQHQRVLWLPIGFFVALALVMLASWIASPAEVLPAYHGFTCLNCIAACALLPGALVLVHMRRMASTQSATAGAAAVIAAFSIGALVVRLEEQTDHIPHILQWHYLPMLAVALIGLALGKLLLRW